MLSTDEAFHPGLVVISSHCSKIVRGNLSNVGFCLGSIPSVYGPREFFLEPQFAHLLNWESNTNFGRLL